MLHAHAYFTPIIIREIMILFTQPAELVLLVCIMYEHPCDSRSTAESAEPGRQQGYTGVTPQLLHGSP